MDTNCPLIVDMLMANCTHMVAGLEANVVGTTATLTGSTIPVKITGHDLDFGTAEGDGAKQTVTFTWTTSSTPLCATMAVVPT